VIKEKLSKHLKEGYIVPPAQLQKRRSTRKSNLYERQVTTYESATDWDKILQKFQ